MREGTASGRTSRNSQAVLRFAFRDQLRDGELARAVNGHEEIELALCRSQPGAVDMEEANRTALAPLLPGSVASMSGRREIPCRCKHLGKEERVRCGIVGCKAYRQSSGGKSVCRRKATMTASSSSPRTVERSSLGPVLRSSSVCRFRHLATVFGSIPNSRLSSASEACDRCIAALTACVLVAQP